MCYNKIHVSTEIKVLLSGTICLNSGLHVSNVATCCQLNSTKADFWRDKLTTVSSQLSCRAGFKGGQTGQLPRAFTTMGLPQNSKKMLLKDT